MSDDDEYVTWQPDLEVELKFTGRSTWPVRQRLRLKNRHWRQPGRGGSGRKPVHGRRTTGRSPAHSRRLTESPTVGPGRKWNVTAGAEATRVRPSRHRHHG